jgi:hypothetical protein
VGVNVEFLHPAGVFPFLGSPGITCKSTIQQLLIFKVGYSGVEECQSCSVVDLKTPDQELYLIPIQKVASADLGDLRSRGMSGP